MAVAPALPDAVVFDCDGTLVDTESATIAAMRDVLAGMGHALSHEQGVRLVGHTWPSTRDWMVEEFGLSDRDLATFHAGMEEQLGSRMGDPGIVLDDAAALVRWLVDAGVPLAVCTSADRDHLAAVLRLEPYVGAFAAAVAREDVERHKPDPLPYATAVDRLAAAVGVPLTVDRVAVVEDSVVGVAAATAAGCWTIAVDRGLGHDLTGADVVVERLSPAMLVGDSGGPQVVRAG